MLDSPKLARRCPASAGQVPQECKRSREIQAIIAQCQHLGARRMRNRLRWPTCWKAANSVRPSGIPWDCLENDSVGSFALLWRLSDGSQQDPGLLRLACRTDTCQACQVVWWCFFSAVPPSSKNTTNTIGPEKNRSNAQTRVWWGVVFKLGNALVSVWISGARWRQLRSRIATRPARVQRGEVGGC